ncbi:MAG: A24 family peptidase [Candidatus Woesearchaeota archaeon]|nr:A24 family peptidase [Candidatus Woesearchaeota archaeon]
MLDLLVIIAVIAVAIGSYTDIRTLEVPDWLNYVLIAVGLGGNLIYSIFYNDYTFIIRSVLGLVACLVLGTLMFYTGQWGGGDSKMLFGLGAIFGLSYPPAFDFLPKFLVNLLFAGALYGMAWIIYLAVKNRKKIFKIFVKELKKQKKVRLITGTICLAVSIVIFFLKLPIEFKMIFITLICFLYLMNYVFIYVRLVEKISMIQMIDPKKLTEGDWIVDDIKIGNKILVGPKDLGIKKEQIAALLKLQAQGKIRKVKVKYGIPFIPSFLIALIYTLVTNTIFFFQLL